MNHQLELFLKQQLQEPYMKELQAWIRKERETKTICPAPNLVMNALKTCDYHNLKVVIVGNEPYNLPGMDMGIAFSSISEFPQKELVYMQKEIRRQLYPEFSSKTLLFKTNNLTQWTQQGVLLINSVLTVELEKPGSHKGRGWEKFTHALMHFLNNHPNRLVFIFMGKNTWNYSRVIWEGNHRILNANEAGGPNAFKECNEFIRMASGNKKAPIDWHLLT